jgi:ectoine hydroxylase-related dioxygenase (phytanoyl-CoA dioxygenase family)
MARIAADLPAEAQRDLREKGYCLVPGALSGDRLGKVRDTLYGIAEFDAGTGRMRAYGYGKDAGANKRIWNLISRHPLFAQLVEDELALGFVRSLIGWPAMLSSSSANIVVCDDDNLAVHADQTYMPEPWDRPHGVNVAWCVDDFTAANGATMVAAGSHLLNRNWREEDGIDGFVPVEAVAGSMLVMDGRLWHTTGRATGGGSRAGIFNWYTLPIYLPQENWFLSLDPAVRQFGSEELLTLLGFRPGLLGRVNGEASL